MLRALQGDEAAVSHCIALMLDCAGEDEPKEGSALEKGDVEKIVEMIQDSSSSHLMEVGCFSRIFHGTFVTATISKTVGSQCGRM